MMLIFLPAMTASLAFLSIVKALSIDNQLMIIKSDCYERMAIGQRLNPKDIYKTFSEYKTVAECQMVCTKEKSACKSFSFGISAKGNATCEISIDPIKETADLKPIGTISDTDFDLYIKKLGCSLVIDKTPKRKPPENHHTPPSKLPTLGNINPDEESNHHYYDTDSQSKPTIFSYNNQYAPTYAPDYNQHYLSNDSEIHNVKTLVSVASGPDTFLDPVHDILVSKPRCGICGDKGHIENYGSNEHRPPFRPQILNNPYEEHRPEISSGNSFYAYGSGGQVHRPYDVTEKPDPEKFYYRPNDKYEKPPRKPFRPEPSDYLSTDWSNRYGTGASQKPYYYDYLYEERPQYYRPVNNQDDFQFEKPVDKRPFEYNKPDKPLLSIHVFEDIDKKPLPIRKPVQKPLAIYNDRWDEERPSRPSYGSGYNCKGCTGSYPVQKPLNIYNDRWEEERPKPGYSSDSNCKDCTSSHPIPKPLNVYDRWDEERPSSPSISDSNNCKDCKGSHSIVTQSIGHNGEQITSIITEINNGKFKG